MSAPSAIEIRDLRSLDDCRAVVAIQEAVWGRDGETVPASVLLVSAKSGGILIGAFPPSRSASADDLMGFVWSLAGVRDGAPTQWSHMLGVLPRHRESRIGERLKLAQRDRAIAAGVQLIEWTFDPLLAANAHFNLQVLGAVGARYGVDVYGRLAGPLHRGTPTDRLVAEWWIRSSRVEDRLRAREPGGPPAPSPAVRGAFQALETTAEGPWVRCVRIDTTFDERRVLVPIPPRFLEMQQQATDLALEWRLAIREIMIAAFDDGFRAVDFQLDRDHGGGAYLLARDDAGH